MMDDFALQIVGDLMMWSRRVSIRPVVGHLDDFLVGLLTKSDSDFDHGHFQMMDDVALQIVGDLMMKGADDFHLEVSPMEPTEVDPLHCHAQCQHTGPYPKRIHPQTW